MNELISVIIPTYNTKGGLQKSIDSVLSQTYKNIEIIIIDDNDPNSQYRKETENIMMKYQKISQVHYIKHDVNKNGAAARNTGIRASKGQYITFLDDDDKFLPEKIEKQYNYLEKHPEHDAVYTQIIGDKGVIRMTPFEGNCIVEILTERTRMFTSCLMLRRAAVETIGGFNESFRRHQDYELMVKYFHNGFTIGCIQEPLIVYSTTGGNAVAGKGLEELKYKFLAQFDDVIMDLERKHVVSKRWIYANNFAFVCISHLASKRYFRALLLFLKYSIICPSGFYSYIFFFIKYHIK